MLESRELGMNDIKQISDGQERTAGEVTYLGSKLPHSATWYLLCEWRTLAKNKI